MSLKKWVGMVGAGMVLAGAQSVVAQDAWVDRLSMKGDIRLRHETIDQDDKEDTRHRARMRARLSLSMLINDFSDAHFRLASGSDDPVSSNQSLDGGLSTKDIRFDRAYLEMRAGDEWRFWGGKTPMSFVVIKDLVWDTDLNPDGFSGQFHPGPLFARVGAWWVEERSSDSDTNMYGLQLGVDTEATDTITVLGGASYYYWDNMAGFEPLFEETDSFGNTVVNVGTDDDPTLAYVNDYGVAELFARVTIDLGMPVSFYADYIVNTEAKTDGDTGFMVGAKVGSAKAIGSYELEYNYRDLEADATVAAYSDSDSFGGGTNGKGHKISGKYQVAKNLQIAAALFLNALDPDGEDIDYTRGQIDLVAKF